MTTENPEESENKTEQTTSLPDSMSFRCFESSLLPWEVFCSATNFLGTDSGLMKSGRQCRFGFLWVEKGGQGPPSSCCGLDLNSGRFHRTKYFFEVHQNTTVPQYSMQYFELNVSTQRNRENHESDLKVTTPGRHWQIPPTHEGIQGVLEL